VRNASRGLQQRCRSTAAELAQRARRLRQVAASIRLLDEPST